MGHHADSQFPLTVLTFGDNSGSPYQTNSTTFVNAFSATINAIVGDNILVTFCGTYNNNGGVFAHMTFNFGAATGDVTVPGGTQGTDGLRRVSGGLAFSTSVQYIYTVVAGDLSGGAITVTHRHKSSSGGTISLDSRNHADTQTDMPTLTLSNLRH